MATTYRIAVIGSWESVMGFRALGLETYPVTAPEEARDTIRELAKSGDCGIIYLTEQLAREMSDVLNHYKDELRPAIILIPGREGSLGIGRDNIQRAIERAVGADIL
mgnify:CR=1 FL=1